MGSKGATGFIGKRGPPGNNAECILGETSENLIGMQGYVCALGSMYILYVHCHVCYVYVKQNTRHMAEMLINQDAKPSDSLASRQHTECFVLCITHASML